MQMLFLFGLMTLLLGLRHMAYRYQQAKQRATVDGQPPCNRHSSGLLFLCSFMPLLINAISIYFDYSNIPSTQSNYQLPVIFVYFQSIYWLIFLAPLMLLSRAVLWLFCLLGTRLGNQFLRKSSIGESHVPGWVKPQRTPITPRRLLTHIKRNHPSSFAWWGVEG